MELVICPDTLKKVSLEKVYKRELTNDELHSLMSVDFFSGVFEHKLCLGSIPQYVHEAIADAYDLAFIGAPDKTKFVKDIAWLIALTVPFQKIAYGTPQAYVKRASWTSSLIHENYHHFDRETELAAYQVSMLVNAALLALKPKYVWQGTIRWLPIHEQYARKLLCKEEQPESTQPEPISATDKPPPGWVSINDSHPVTPISDSHPVAPISSYINADGIRVAADEVDDLGISQDVRPETDQTTLRKLFGESVHDKFFKIHKCPDCGYGHPPGGRCLKSEDNDASAD